MPKGDATLHKSKPQSRQFTKISVYSQQKILRSCQRLLSGSLTGTLDNNYGLFHYDKICYCHNLRIMKYGFKKIFIHCK